MPVHRCESGALSLALHPTLPEIQDQNQRVSTPNPPFLPCAMEPGIGILNTIQFIRMRVRNPIWSHTLLWKFPHFYDGTGSSRAAPERPEPQAIFPTSCPSKVKTFLGWCPLGPSSSLEDCQSYMLFSPGNVTHRFHSSTHFQKAHKDDPRSENFTLWAEVHEMLN